MMREDGTDRLHALCGEGRHQLTDSGAEHLHHLIARNSEMNNGGRLSAGLDDLWWGKHRVTPLLACLERPGPGTYRCGLPYSHKRNSFRRRHTNGTNSRCSCPTPTATRAACLKR